jgi:adenine-specific DNA-methyltransferase
MDNNLKKNRGQFFTTKNRVLDALVSLIKNEGTILEPSAGEGHIVKCIEEKLIRDVVCIELDEDKVSNKICNSIIKVDNFFNYIKTIKKFNTVIGNPPFVKLKNVEEETINLLPEKIPGNGNLYYFFIKYCVSLLENGGELIFIVPKEWLFNVSSKFVRDYLQTNGNFTHFIDCGEEKLFDDADVPTLCIFRYEKGFDGKVKYFETLDNFYSNKFEEKTTVYSNIISFTNNNHGNKKISDYFDIKVGLVTGAEKIFKIEGETDLPQEYIINIVGTNRDFNRYLFLDNVNNFENLPKNIQDYLLKNKKKLIGRKIKNFDETNWWCYGALRNVNTMSSNRKRIYGLMKTRSNNIFWVGNESEYFGGGLVGLFVKEGVNIDLNDAVKHLNSKQFKLIMEESNMCSNNKVFITPSVFSNLPFPFLIS